MVERCLRQPFSVSVRLSRLDAAASLWPQNSGPHQQNASSETNWDDAKEALYQRFAKATANFKVTAPTSEDVMAKENCHTGRSEPLRGDRRLQLLRRGS